MVMRIRVSKWELDVRRVLRVEGVWSVEELPAFGEDGSVVFYEIGGVLLGKGALVRMVKEHGIVVGQNKK